MKIKSKKEVVFLILIIFLGGMSIIEAGDSNDLLVPGDNVPVLGDGGKKVPKNEPEPVIKDRKPSTPKPIKFSKQVMYIGGNKFEIRQDIKSKVSDIRGVYPTNKIIRIILTEYEFQKSFPISKIFKV